MHDFECITLSPTISLEEIELIVIDNWIFQVSDFLRLFITSFKYCLTSLKYSSIDISISITFLFDINVAIKMTCPYWSDLPTLTGLVLFFLLKEVLKFSDYFVNNCSKYSDCLFLFFVFLVPSDLHTNCWHVLV